MSQSHEMNDCLPKRVWWRRHCPVAIHRVYYGFTGMFPVGDTSCRTLIDVCVCVCVCVSLSADISLNCAKNDSTDYPEILWVCWV